MSLDNTYNFTVPAGETFQPVLHWLTAPLVSKAITAMTKAAPVAITATGHNIPDGWQAAVVSALGMTEINAIRYPPQGRDWHKATVLDANTVQLNEVSTADASTYTSGGFLVYKTPASLAGVTGVMTIRDTPETGAVLASSLLGGGITLTLNDTTKTIKPVMATTGLTWALGYYDLELTDSAGKVTQLLSGTIAIV